MGTPLPPLNPLRTFEAAARHGSFTQAARELRVTQSAVSRQIGSLEAYLGVRLFDRKARGTRLSPAGQKYFAEIGPAFQLLGAATQRVRRSGRGASLKITVYATFAAKWLLRRLPRFQALHPNIDLRINTSVAPVDFARDPVDAAIQLGRGNWPGGKSVHLFGDEIAPVCSPKLVTGQSLPLPLAELNHCKLLHSHYRRSDWPDWLQSVGFTPRDSGEPIAFPSSLLTYQAAIDGLGIAMGQLPLLQEDLAAGLLVLPFRQTLCRDLAYYLVTPSQPGAAMQSLRLLTDWLLAETAPHALL
jgi:LysR family glycine cleavage system transcriptional activator